ncbi:MAG: FAD-dependent oxidoreductase [Bacillota bacterium]|nr:FAD-dependent oxidoreductase [Bacillota bacterium]
MKILIIGGVAGGATAAARLRRLDENAEIILFERGEYISFANCGLPYYIGGVIANRNSLFVTTREDVESKYNIDVRTQNEVLSIDRNNKEIEVKDLVTGKVYREAYDKLLISTGSSPIVPPLEGIHSANVFTLWNIPDTDKVYNFMRDHNPQKAVVVGGGFIGVEMAENLVHRGLDVSLVEMADQVMAPFDKDMAVLIENHMKENGVNLYLSKGLAAVENDGKYVRLQDGTRLQTDMTILSIGVRPNSVLAKEAGLELNKRNGIVVNDYMQTSDPDIYAVGDAIQVTDFNTGLPTMVPLAGPANKQGRMVAGNILGTRPEAYTGTMGTSIAKIFDLDAASTGLNEKALQSAGKVYGRDYLLTLIHSGSHAGYYPGSLQMTIKILFDLTGKVLGGQIIGYKGVDKRIDVLATAMRFGATVDDLTRLELAYAPPFSSAKDPINMAGFVAQNTLEKRTDVIAPNQFFDVKDQMTILDVREDAEYAMGHIEGAKHIPLTQLRQRLNELDKNERYLIHCAVGARGYFAERILKEKGFTAKNLLGGFRSYQDLHTPHQTRARKDLLLDVEGRPLPDASVSHEIPQSTASLSASDMESLELADLSGLACPGPIVQVNKLLADKAEGEAIRVVATDPGFARDIESWCDNTGNILLENSRKEGKFFATIQKGRVAATPGKVQAPATREKTMIVFDGDLDKAIAAFIIANGAAAMGNKVNMFFTFWGLSIIRKHEKQDVKKNFMSRMFSAMMPRGSAKLKLSQMNFMGAGPKMIRGVMKKHNVDSLEDLIQQALDSGVKITACQMSMDVMGLTKDELLDGVEVGGVASMLNDNDKSNMNLFI